MVSSQEVIAAVQQMVDKIKEPKLEKRFADFNRTMLMLYTDLGLEVTIRFENGVASVIEGTTESPDMKVTTDSRTILGILNGSTSAMRAFMSGKIKADGSARDLMKLQHLLKS
jgi:putative sterol carrier protein